MSKLPKQDPRHTRRDQQELEAFIHGSAASSSSSSDPKNAQNLEEQVLAWDSSDSQELVLIQPHNQLSQARKQAFRGSEFFAPNTHHSSDEDSTGTFRRSTATMPANSSFRGVDFSALQQEGEQWFDDLDRKVNQQIQIEQPNRGSSKDKNAWLYDIDQQTNKRKDGQQSPSLVQEEKKESSDDDASEPVEIDLSELLVDDDVEVTTHRAPSELNTTLCTLVTLFAFVGIAALVTFMTMRHSSPSDPTNSPNNNTYDDPGCYATQNGIANLSSIITNITNRTLQPSLISALLFFHSFVYSDSNDTMWFKGNCTDVLSYISALFNLSSELNPAASGVLLSAFDLAMTPSAKGDPIARPPLRIAQCGEQQSESERQICATVPGKLAKGCSDIFRLLLEKELGVCVDETDRSGAITCSKWPGYTPMSNPLSKYYQIMQIAEYSTFCIFKNELFCKILSPDMSQALFTWRSSQGTIDNYSSSSEVAVIFGRYDGEMFCGNQYIPLFRLGLITPLQPPTTQVSTTNVPQVKNATRSHTKAQTMSDSDGDAWSSSKIMSNSDSDYDSESETYTGSNSGSGSQSDYWSDSRTVSLSGTRTPGYPVGDCGFWTTKIAELNQTAGPGVLRNVLNILHNYGCNFTGMVNLINKNITYPVLKLFVPVLYQMVNVTDFRIATNFIGDDGVKALIPVWEVMPNFTKTNVVNTNITRAGIDALIVFFEDHFMQIVGIGSNSAVGVMYNFTGADCADIIGAVHVQNPGYNASCFQL